MTGVSRTSATVVDVDSLIDAVQAVRADTGATARDISTGLGLSPSTLTRLIKHRKVPDAHAFVTILDWLGSPAAFTRQRPRWPLSKAAIAIMADTSAFDTALLGRMERAAEAAADAAGEGDL